MKGWMRCGLVLLTAWIGLGSKGCEKQDSYGKEGMVAAAHPMAAQAGLEVLKRGGHAIDAAVAAGYTLAVVDPHSAGIGGGGFMVYYDQATGEVSVLDYRESAPAGMASWSDTMDAGTYRYGGLSIGVPGMVKGLMAAHQAHGKLPFKELLDPAIQVAEQGFKVSPKFKAIIAANQELLLKDPLATDIFLRKTVSGYVPRRKVTQSRLAQTLKAIRDHGLEAFYGNEPAGQIAAAVQKAGGALAVKDLQDYQPKQRQPLRGTYRGFEVVTMGPPSAGGMTLLLALRLLEPYNLAALQPDSPQALALIIRAYELAARHAADVVADPEKEKVDLSMLTGPAWLQQSLPKMPFQPGNVWSLLPDKNLRFSSLPNPEPNLADPGNTTHFSVVDEAGNMVAITQTINYSFGSGVVVPDMGVILNNELFDFSYSEASINRPKPGKIPRSNMTPTLILQDGRPVATLGTPGGPRIPSTVLQILMHKIDFQAFLQGAVDAPRVFYDWKRGNLYYEDRLSVKTMEAVTRLLNDKELKLVEKPGYDRYFGGAHGVWLSPLPNAQGESTETVLEGAADPRRDGKALGY